MKLLNPVKCKILLFSLFVCMNAFGQKEIENIRLNYIYETKIDSNEVVVSTPIGRNVNVMYDKFFKSFTISYSDKNYSTILIKFEFVNEDKNGNLLVKDIYGKYYYSFSNLDEKKFLFILREKINGIVRSFEITNELK